MDDLLLLAQDFCEKHDVSLVYLTRFGSSLYGTDLPGKSDIDIKGLFLPSRKSLLLGKAPTSLHFSTANDKRRNTVGDIDLDIWSVQHWFLDLLRTGDIPAIDLLFSPSNKKCTLFRDPRLDRAFDNPLRLLDTSKKSYITYCLNETKKYGIRGSRVGVLKGVRQWLREQCTTAKVCNDRLENYLDALIATCSKSRFCSVTKINDQRVLQLCGKFYMGTIKMSEVLFRIETIMQQIGKKADQADQNIGIDFKALSHALRAIEQMKEIFCTGKVSFPLAYRKAIIAVKRGDFSWHEMEKRLIRGIAEVEELKKEESSFSGEYDADFAESCVLECESSFL